MSLHNVSKITPVILVIKGSSRCKNIRNFEALKKIKDIG